MADFTLREGQYLAFIESYKRLHGRAPAEAELQRYFGVTPPTVHQMILTLERKGLITRVPKVARSIEVQVSPTLLPPLDSVRGAKRESLPLRGDAGERAPLARASSGRRARRKLDPAVAYIDSPALHQRLRYADHLSALVVGKYGVYATRVRLVGRLDGECTCPSDVRPCKHIRALKATWKRNRDTFIDVRQFLRSLKSLNARQLITMLEQVFVAFPDALGFFGLPVGDTEDEECDWPRG